MVDTFLGTDISNIPLHPNPYTGVHACPCVGIYKQKIALKSFQKSVKAFNSIATMAKSEMLSGSEIAAILRGIDEFSDDLKKRVKENEVVA